MVQSGPSRWDLTAVLSGDGSSTRRDWRRVKVEAWDVWRGFLVDGSTYARAVRNLGRIPLVND